MLLLTFPVVFTPHSKRTTWRGEIITLLFAFSLFSALKGKNEMKWLHLHPLPLPSQLDVAPSGLWRICIEEETTWESGV